MNRTTERRTALLVGVCVSPTFQPALERSIETLRAKQPQATDEQLVDFVMQVGIVFIHDALACQRFPDVMRLVESHPTPEEPRHAQGDY